MSIVRLLPFFLALTSAVRGAGEASPQSTPQPPPPTSTAAVSLSPQDWNEIRTARSEALKANPELAQRMATLSLKLRQFQAKLNKEMLKTDPSIAPYLPSYNPAAKPPDRHNFQSNGPSNDRSSDSSSKSDHT